MKYTFGSTSAAMRLEELVSEFPIARRQISTLLSRYTNQLLLITLAKDQSTVRLCMELLRDYNLRRLDMKSKLTPLQKSFAKNVVMTRYRAFRKGFDDVNRAIQRRKSK